MLGQGAGDLHPQWWGGGVVTEPVAPCGGPGGGHGAVENRNGRIEDWAGHAAPSAATPATAAATATATASATATAAASATASATATASTTATASSCRSRSQLATATRSRSRSRSHAPDCHWTARAAGTIPNRRTTGSSNGPNRPRPNCHWTHSTHSTRSTRSTRSTHAPSGCPIPISKPLRRPRHGPPGLDQDPVDHDAPLRIHAPGNAHELVDAQVGRAAARHVPARRVQLPPSAPGSSSRHRVSCT